jgi:hypothetical protein
MLIRFMPDNWLDALVRPIGMAVPGGGIYVEIIAPDFRFVFVLGLVLVLALLAWRLRAGPGLSRSIGLLAFCSVSFIPWLATTGNGRYFLVTLFLVGPLCVALAHLLPVARRFRILLVTLMLAVQCGLLLFVEPWNSWGLAPWREAPAFAIDVPAEVRQEPATYVTLSGISYALVAHRFHPQSRWINLNSQIGRPAQGADAQRARKLLAESRKLYLFYTSLPGQGLTATRLPVQLVDTLDLSLAEFQLRVDRDRDCRFLPSHGLTSLGVKPGDAVPAKPEEQRGFWLCPLLHEATSEQPARPEPPADVEAAFAGLERACPRYFPRGPSTMMLPLGARRFYPNADMRAYVLENGRVLYKYMRALNAVDVGTAKEVADPAFRMDCDNIRGRSGLPWDREI